MRVCSFQIALALQKLSGCHSWVQAISRMMQDRASDESPPRGDDLEGLRALVKGVMGAAKQGTIRLAWCFVKNAPFTTQGDLLPVVLPCGCTTCHTASLSAKTKGKCPLCPASVLADAECRPNIAVLRVIQAEKQGLLVPEIPRSSIVVTEEIARGSQGSVWRIDGCRQQPAACRCKESSTA